MAKYTVEEIKSFQEMGILTESDATLLIEAIVASENNNCFPTGAAFAPNGEKNKSIRSAMHWYDRYINEYKEMCWNSDDCDGDCDYCDEFRDALIDDIGANDRVWPYDYPTQELYVSACSFANEADEIVSDEEVQWWCGNPGYFRGISSPAIDPRDFTTREEYLKALYRQLFAEAVARHPEIPFTELWYRAFVSCLNDSESPLCAEKSVLGILDEVSYSNYFSKGIITSYPSEQEHEIRYSAWDKDFSARGHYDHWGYSKTLTRRYQKEQYTAHQFRNDLLYHYPELFFLVIRAAAKECGSYDSLERYGIRKVSLESGYEKDSLQTEESIFEFLPEVVINALYLHDLYDFDVEECVQNGLTGLIKALKNGFWFQNTMFYDREDYLKWEIRVNMIQYSLELADYFGFSLNRKTAKVIESIIYDRRSVKNISIYNLCDDYRVTDRERYIMDKIETFFDGKIQDVSVALLDYEEATNCDEMLFNIEAISLLQEMVSRLPQREQEYLIKRYGLNGCTPQTLEEIAVVHNHTREWARQVEKKALELLKKMPEILSLCELTGHPIPEGVKYLSHVQRKEDKPQQQEEQTPKKIKDCDVSVRSYNTLNNRGIFDVEQLLSLNMAQLRELSINIKVWNDIVVGLKQSGIMPSEAIIMIARPYRPRTMLWIDDCGFTSKFNQVMTRANIYRVDALQAMSVSELKRYRSMTEDDWLQVDQRLRELGVIPSEAIMELAGTDYD